MKGTRDALPGLKELEEVGSVCRERLTFCFMSWFSVRGDDPSQLGSSQLLRPNGSALVGLDGALSARSYICDKPNNVLLKFGRSTFR